FQRVAVDGAFKTPGLRNVELTGPYFHNGGVATLRQVVQFYNRGGNFCDFNATDLDPNIKALNLSAQQEQQLVKFLVSLTDPRVKFQMAPFDHPELHLPADGLDEVGSKRLEPVGVWGSFNGLKPFLNLNPQDAIFTPDGICVIGK
ncbi:MAG TPA: cytochrome-c peroxidase, partial [Pseudomonadales bacterium]|nr:cytochrome-c peroxidase [Pseudomonadales bacterium]